jgi:MFS family permease
VYGLVLFASVLNGLGSACLWIGQGKYFSDCAPESKKGFYYSVFWFIFQGNMIVGNIMSGFLLDKGNQFLYFITITGVAVVAALMFLFLRKPFRFERKVLTEEG